MKKSRILKKQILRLQYLETEYEECLEVHDEAKKEFEYAIRNLHYKLNVFDEDLDKNHAPKKAIDGDTTKVLEDVEIEKDKVDVPPWAKKLFREAVKLTHPDKLPKSLSKEMRKKLQEQYQEVKEAMEDYDFVKIALVAQDLNIDLKDVSDADLSLFRKKETMIQEQIKKIKMSIFWKWSISTDEQKDQIIQEFLKSKGWTRPQAARKKSRKGKHPGQSISWARTKSLKKE